jgi:N utilization substance protein B
MTRPDPAGRRRARESALQMLYQWEVGRVSVHEATSTYWATRESDEQLANGLRSFAEGLVRGTIERVGDIDKLLAARAHHWRVERMAVIDRLVLRLAVFELLTEPSTPAKVIINEALELARTFSGDESVAFVNGVLDGVRKDLQRE